MAEEKKEVSTVDASKYLAKVQSGLAKKYPTATVVIDPQKASRLWIKDDFAIKTKMALDVAMAMGGVDFEDYSSKRAGPAISLTFLK